MHMSRSTDAVLLLALAACSGQTPKTGPPADSGTGDSVTSPARLRIKLTAMPMLPTFRAHLDSVAAHPAMMRSSMSQHQTEVRNLVNAMHADMMALGMHSDPAYEALADSVVSGSARLASAGGAEFDRLVAQHVDQMRRLAAVYETKTSAMR